MSGIFRTPRSPCFINKNNWNSPIFVIKICLIHWFAFIYLCIHISFFHHFNATIDHSSYLCLTTSPTSLSLSLYLSLSLSLSLCGYLLGSLHCREPRIDHHHGLGLVPYVYHNQSSGDLSTYLGSVCKCPWCTLCFSFHAYRVFCCKKARRNLNSNHTKFENDILSDPGNSTKKPMECSDGSMVICVFFNEADSM